MKTKLVCLLAIAGLFLAQSCKKDDDKEKTIDLAYNSSQFVENACSDKDDLQSSTDSGTDIVVINEIDEGIKVYWINFSGTLTNYEENLAPGATWSINTFLTHPWYFTTLDETCIGIVTCLRASQNDTVRIVYN